MAYFTHPLTRDIVKLLLIKAAAIGMLFALFFSPFHRPNITKRSLDAHILGVTPDPNKEPKGSHYD